MKEINEENLADLDQEAEQRLTAAIAHRSVAEARAVGAWAGSLAGFALANADPETAQSNHRDGVYALARVVARIGEAQGIAREEAETYYRAAVAGIEAELQKAAAMTGGHA